MRDEEVAEPAKPELWTAPFTLLTIANFGLSMAFFALMATMATEAITSFNATNTQAGLVNSVFVLGAMSARFVAGRAIELKGYRTVMTVALILHLLAISSYLLTVSLPVTLIVRTAHGIGFGLAQTAVGGTVMAAVPPQRRGEGSGWFTIGMSVATGLAPFAAMILSRTQHGQTAVYAMCITVAVMSLGCAISATRHLPARLGVQRTELRPHPVSLSGFVDARAFPIATVVALCAFSFASVLTFMDGFAKTASLENSAAWYFVVYAAVIVVSRPAAGILQDRYGDNIVVIPLIISLITGMLVTAYATKPVTLLTGAVLLGLGYGTVLSAGQAIAVSKVGAERAGLAVASYFLLVDFGTGIAPAIMGTLVDPLGYRHMMAVAAAVGGLAFLLYLTQISKQRG